LRASFIAFASVVGLALAVMVRHEGRAPSTRRAAAAASDRSAAEPRLVISKRDRDAIYSYYGIDQTSGGCPPGLSRDANGCLPPGGGRGSWAIGRRLSPSVLTYPLPAVLLGQISPPPRGYEYARVGNDVLILGFESRVVAAALAGIAAN
jgi:Ni/Co efflux regulator RcnB